MAKHLRGRTTAHAGNRLIEAKEIDVARDKGTKFYCSEGLVCFEGDLEGTVNGDDDETNIVVFSDGTVLDAVYDSELEIWKVNVRRSGDLFINLTPCDDNEEEPASDMVLFKPGLKWAIASYNWETVT